MSDILTLFVHIDGKNQNQSTKQDLNLQIWSEPFSKTYKNNLEDI